MRNLFTSDVKVKHTNERDKPFRKYFEFKSSHAVCNDIDSLIKTSYNIEHRPSDWILFIDGSVLSLKAVLLHNENVLAPIPLYYGKNTPECYESMKILINAFQYYKYNWLICCDFKVRKKIHFKNNNC